MANRAGWVYGKSAAGLPSTSTHTDFEKQHQKDGRNQATVTAEQGTTGGQTLPVHGKDKHREVGGSRDTERQANHEGDVLLFEQDAKDDGHETKANGSNPGNANFSLASVAFPS
jgi:hypothetical protein